MLLYCANSEKDTDTQTSTFVERLLLVTAANRITGPNLLSQ